MSITIAWVSSTNNSALFTTDISFGIDIRVYLNGVLYTNFEKFGKDSGFIIYGLDPNTTYNTYIESNGGEGWSDPSNTVYFTTTLPPLSFGINWFFSPIVKSTNIIY